MNRPSEYRGRSIEQPYRGRWYAYGPEWEAEWFPDGGWVGNGQSAEASTYDDLIAEIDAFLDGDES